MKGALARVPKQVWWGLGAVALLVAFSKRKEIKAVALATLTAAQKTALKAIVPAKGEPFVDLAFELAPKYGFSPLFVLSFLSVESGF